MSRIELAGLGGPIPTVALPDPNLDENLPAQTLLLPPGPFLKFDYVALGYTHYEVICVGAVGGNGGSNPNPWRYSHGGGGGGGGRHRVVGLLADIPDAVMVTIGAPGTPGTDVTDDIRIGAGVPDYTTHLLVVSPDPAAGGQVLVDTHARPMVVYGQTFITAGGLMVPPYVCLDTMGNHVPTNYYNNDASAGFERIVYILQPNPNYVSATDGGDGGYSSFGDICQASGGKGGKKAPMWAIYNFQYAGLGGRTGETQAGGDGGEGGIGGQTTPGGGGAGGWTEEIIGNPYLAPTGYVAHVPEEGTWDGEIGEGGGGGRGGSGSASTPLMASQNGANGSFNYADTSVYGPKQNRSNDPVNGKTTIPGTGGGAKVSPLVTFGSRGPGSDPAGGVLIRIFKTE